jgi:hypothetical protein
VLREGFVADKGHHGMPDVQKWVDGPPEKSFWVGIKMRGRQVLPVMTYRCERCGMLESYANVPAP